MVLILLACAAPGSDTGPSYTTTGTTDGGTWTVDYTTEPAIRLGEDFALQLVVTPPTELNVVADALLDGEGMEVDPDMASEAAGLWTASPLRFHEEGEWEIVVGVSSGAASERVTFLVDCCG